MTSVLNKENVSLREDILTFQFSQMHLPLSSKEDIVSSVVFREEDKSATVTEICTS